MDSKTAATDTEPDTDSKCKAASVIVGSIGLILRHLIVSFENEFLGMPSNELRHSRGGN